MHNKRFQGNPTSSQGGKSSQVFEYSKLFLQVYKWWKVSNGLDDFKVTLYICPNYMNDDIHSDHGYLDTWDIYAGPPWTGKR